MRLPGCSDLLRLFRRYVALGAGRIGIDREPDNALARTFILQLLHVAAAVMLLHERTFRIQPFQHAILTLVLRTRVRRAFRVGERTIWRSAAYRRRVERDKCCSERRT